MAELTLEERLYKIFSNVNDWLKFSEAKNAMLLAFNAASIYGITKSFEVTFIKSNNTLVIYLSICILFLIFSSICALVSFAPRVKIIKGGWFAESDTPNVLYFECLKTKSAIEILEEVSGIKGEEKFTKIEKDIAEQIRQNSIIASRKFSYFTIALWLCIAAYITFPLAGFFFLYTFMLD